MTGAVAPWRLHLASTIVGLLAIGLGVTTWISQSGSTDQTPASEEGSVITIGISATTSATLELVSAVAVADDEAVRSAVQDALAAWGVFAGSGDLADVEPFFDPDGPQWVSLSAEAGSVGAEFTVEIVERSLETGVGSSVLVGGITFASNGDSRVVTWTIELRLAPDGQWRIWAVSDTAP